MVLSRVPVCVFCFVLLSLCLVSVSCVVSLYTYMLVAYVFLVSFAVYPPTPHSSGFALRRLMRML